MKKLLLTILAAVFVILGGHSARAQTILIGSLDCELNRGSAFATTGQCEYRPVFGIFPVMYRADVRRVLFARVVRPPVRAIWGVYGPLLTLSLAGTYVRAGSRSQMLVGGPERAIQLHPFTATPGDDLGGGNVARAVTQLNLH